MIGISFLRRKILLICLRLRKFLWARNRMSVECLRASVGASRLTRLGSRFRLHTCRVVVAMFVSPAIDYEVDGFTCCSFEPLVYSQRLPVFCNWCIQEVILGIKKGLDVCARWPNIIQFRNLGLHSANEPVDGQSNIRHLTHRCVRHVPKGVSRDPKPKPNTSFDLYRCDLSESQ
jgi:hypothetical protein